MLKATDTTSAECSDSSEEESKKTTQPDAQKITVESVTKTEALFKNRPNVNFAYLFGSYAKGYASSSSDLDIGVFFKEKPDILQLAGLRADLQKTLHFDKIDLVSLNGASPILCFEAISGKRIFARDRSDEAAIISLIAREYEDETGMLVSTTR